MTILKQPLSKLRAKSVSGPQVLIVVASVVTILITLVEMFRGALTVGISTDAPETVRLLDKTISTGWSDTSVEDRWRITAREGLSFQILVHVVNLARANESWTKFSYSAETYAVHNLVAVLLGIISLSAVGIIIWLVTRSASISLFGSAVLAAFPVFMGHAMMNPKDIPGATGFTLVTAGSIIALKGLNRCGTKQSRMLVKTTSAGFIAVGSWIGVGTRPALWLPFLGVVVFTLCVLAYMRLRTRDVKRSSSNNGREFLVVLLGAIIGYVLVAVSHIQYTPNLLRWLSISLASSNKNPVGNNIGSLVAGQRLSSNDLPWWYLPAWVGASIPLLLIVFIALGTCIGLWKLLGRAQDLPSRASYGLVLAQAYALPLAAVVAGSVMYNAQRHHLYMYPALAVLAGVGLKWLLDRSNQSKSANSARVWQWVIAGTAAFALVYPTIERLRLHPYEYTYLNEVATIGGINGRWETDYYNASLREAITRVPPDLYPYFYAPPENMDTYFYLRGLNYDPKNVASEDEYWRINVTVSGREMPGNCRDVDSVTRNFRGEDVVMSWVGICTGKP